MSETFDLAGDLKLDDPLTAICPECAAGKGKQCTWRDPYFGHAMSNVPHAARRAAVRALPFPDTERSA